MKLSEVINVDLKYSVNYRSYILHLSDNEEKMEVQWNSTSTIYTL